MEQTINQSVLLALFRLIHEGPMPNMTRLAEYTYIRRGKVAQALVNLEKLGLCHATQFRLTMKGLVIASSLDAQNTLHKSYDVDIAA